MRTYAQIRPTFWTRGSGKKLRGNPVAQVLALYLMTAPSSNMVGLYYLPMTTICHETGLTEEQVREVLPLLSEIVFYDHEEGLAWLPEGASYQLGEALAEKDKRKPAILRDLDAFGEHDYVVAFWERYGVSYNLPPRAFRRRSKGLPPGEKPPFPVPVPVLSPAPVSDAREDGPEPVKCPGDLLLTDDQLASCEVDIGMPREDGVALCKHFVGKWKTDPPKPLGQWRKALWTAVTSSWKDPNERRKLVRPPGLVEHERVQKSADHETARLDANARHDQRRWLVDACLDGLFGESMRTLAEATKTHPNPVDEEAAIDELERRYERGKKRNRGRENGPQPAASAITGALAKPARKASA